MTTFIEDELRRMFVEDAERAPELPPSSVVIGQAQQGADLLHRRRSRQVRYGVGASVLVAASIAALSMVLWGPLKDQQSPGQPSAQVSESTTPRPDSPTGPATPGATGALPDPALLRCATSYSAGQLPSVSAFAFDGTVVEIGASNGQRPEDKADYVGVTFEVKEWFDGGAGPSATVDMFPADALAFEATPPAYEVGTRLLVSGNSRTGGRPMDQAVADGCGFTRYYDAQTAQAWRAAYR